MKYKKNKLCVFVVLFASFRMASAASLMLSNFDYYASNIILQHEAGGTSSFAVNTSLSGATDPAPLSNSVAYASTYANSDYLSLATSSSVDASTIDQLGLDYVIAEATAWFKADLAISGGAGNIFLSINAAYNGFSTTNPNTLINAEQSIRIFNNTNDVVFGYLHGISDPGSLDNILLESGATYRFEIMSTAYTKANAGYSASNQREFSASLSVSEVPLPGTLLFLLSGTTGLFLTGRSSVRKRFTNRLVPVNRI